MNQMTFMPGLSNCDIPTAKYSDCRFNIQKAKLSVTIFLAERTVGEDVFIV